MTTELLEGSDLVVAAKNIRRELKAAWPNVKFSARTSRFSGGDSIDVEWIDGPATPKVREIIDKYAEGSFDGMTDYYDYNRGEARAFTERHGGAKYVHASREYSDELVQRAIEEIAAKYGADNRPTVAQYRSGNAWNVAPVSGNASRTHNWQDLIHQTCYATSV